MTSFEPGDIVHAPFPHVERAIVVRRPALVLSIFNTRESIGGMLAWALMITNADRPAWFEDVPIPDASRQGLIIPSKVRTAKVATLATADMVRIGHVDDGVWAAVRSIVQDALELS